MNLQAKFATLPDVSVNDVYKYRRQFRDTEHTTIGMFVEQRWIAEIYNTWMIVDVGTDSELLELGMIRMCNIHVYEHEHT